MGPTVEFIKTDGHEVSIAAIVIESFEKLGPSLTKIVTNSSVFYVGVSYDEVKETIQDAG